MKGRLFDFPVNNWLDAKEGIFAQTEFTLSSNGFHDEPVKPPAKPNPFGLSEFNIFILIIVGAVTQWLVPWTLDRAVWVRAPKSLRRILGQDTFLS